jgi:hypothetical protein
MRTLCLSLSLLAFATGVSAQYPGGARDRLGAGDLARQQQREANKPRQLPGFTDPMQALEKELPSLKLDLKLNGEQMKHWEIFERQVRAASEATRTRAKQQFTMRSAEEGKGAVYWVGSVSENDVQRSDAMKEAASALRALDATLNAEQRAMLDRRFRQAQSEPLGQ